MTERRLNADRRSSGLGGRRQTDHGTRVAYQYDGCRCPLCVQAEATYHLKYAKGQIAGWVDAGTARAHLERLRCREQGKPRVGLRRAAALSGVPRRTLQRIVNGQPQIHPDTERRILGVTQPTLADGQIASQGESYQTRERLRRLIEEQLSLPWLRARVGRYAVTQARQRKRQGETGARVTVKTWRRVRALFEFFEGAQDDGATC